MDYKADYLCMRCGNSWVNSASEGEGYGTCTTSHAVSDCGRCKDRGPNQDQSYPSIFEIEVRYKR